MNPSTKWVVHSIMNCSSFYSSNIMAIGNLIYNQEYNAANIVLTKLISDYPKVEEYQFFKKVLDFHTETGRKKIILLQEIAEGLRHDIKLQDRDRIRLNIIVITETRKIADEFRFNYLIEKLITSQMEIMKNNVSDFYTILQLYSSSLSYLKRQYENKHYSLNREEKNHYLLVRTLLVRYFERDDETLKKEIDEAIKESPPLKATFAHLKEMLKYLYPRGNPLSQQFFL